MACSVQQAIRERWADQAASYGLASVPCTSGADNKVFGHGWAPEAPLPPYVVLVDNGEITSLRCHDATADGRSMQLRVYATSHEDVMSILSGARAMLDSGQTGWRPTTDEGELLDVRLGRGQSVRFADNRHLGVLNIAAMVSVARTLA